MSALNFLPSEWALTYLRQRLLAHIITEPNTGCWFFLESYHNDRGRISFMGKAILASRASYIAFIGDIPANMNVLHRCGLSECINPAHLYAGTQSQNTLDAVAHKTHNTRKLGPKEVLEIRANWPRLSQPTLAKMYGVTDANINYILKRKTWKNI